MLRLDTNSYYVFSDESNITASRFVSISAITINASQAQKAHKELDILLSKSNVSEFKWKKLSSAKYRFAAIKIIDFILENLHKYQLRIDTLIWDTKDKRHEVIGRDDIQNFERMFFHLHNSLMRKQSSESKWHIRPDERTDLDWETINKCLKNKSLWEEYYRYPLIKEFYSKYCYQIDTFRQMDSTQCRFNQVADMFAGIGAYTRQNKDTIKKALNISRRQSALFDDNSTVLNLSNSDKERLEVIEHLNLKCKHKRLGVSLKTHGYFCTYNPTNPINFWHYVVQHENDKAPIKE